MTDEEAQRKRYEQRVKSSRTFILGAGFSAAAGVPLTSALLKKAMAKFEVECPGVFSRVDGYAKQYFCAPYDEPLDYSSVSFSELCTFLEYVELREYGGGERWKDSGSREKLCLRFYLAKTIVECTPAAEDMPFIYMDFVHELHENDVVISFNWDPLLEIALHAAGKQYTYNFKEQEAIKLSKLHGSVNWRLGEPERFCKPVNTLDWQSLEFTEGMMDVEIFHTDLLHNINNWRGYEPLGEVEPFLVLPGYGKAFDVRSNAVCWYKPEFAFALTHDVFIIGLSLAPDDFFIRSLFVANLPDIGSYSGIEGRHIHIINPDPASESNYQFILSGGSATLHQECFNQKHIELMRRYRVAT